MERRIHSCGSVLVLALALISFADAEQYSGVKGGYYQQYNSQPSNETGICYKRLPYSEAVQLNTTGHIHIAHPGVGHSGVKSSNRQGWVTIIDCCDGYVRDQFTGNCTVYCEGGCIGGVCVPGGVCTCEAGWNAINGECKPICRRPCSRNAYCFSPDYCVCQHGYEDAPNGECKPICSGGCENGECVAYQVCRCNRGYVLNDYRKCEPVCEGGCPHGRCTGPGVCTCDNGYLNPPGETGACLPDCGPHGCNGGECTSPGVCTCQPGYIHDYRTFSCVPDCPTGCPERSRCVAPNRCYCEPGYYLNPQTRKCEQTRQPTSPYDRPNSPYDRPNNVEHSSNSPYDRPGSHSQTSPYDRPNSGQTQQPNSPYENLGHVQCDRTCINAECTGWNECTCNEGHIPDPRDPTQTRCIAACPNGCPNGVCSGPNFCICKPGFVKDRSVKGSQRCVPREEPRY